MSFLAILTYVRRGAPAGVRRRLPAALASLESSGFPGQVYIVDDGSDDKEHQAFLLQYVRKNPRYGLFVRPHGGIARAKNTCLRLFLDSGEAVGFLAEDDTLFKQPGWWTLYEEAHQALGIEHFSYAWPEYPLATRKPFPYRGRVLVAVDRLNGIFLTVTPKLIQTIGGFRVYSTPWGAEHSHFTARAVKAGLTPGFVDLPDSGDFIGLNEHAGASVTSEADRKHYAAILKKSPKDQQIWHPIKE